MAAWNVSGTVVGRGIGARDADATLVEITGRESGAAKFLIKLPSAGLFPAAVFGFQNLLQFIQTGFQVLNLGIPLI